MISKVASLATAVGLVLGASGAEAATYNLTLLYFTGETAGGTFSTNSSGVVTTFSLLLDGILYNRPDNPLEVMSVTNIGGIEILVGIADSQQLDTTPSPSLSFSGVLDSAPGAGAQFIGIMQTGTCSETAGSVGCDFLPETAHAFVAPAAELAPVPLPAALPLAVSGLAALTGAGLFRRRKTKAGQA